MKVFLFSFWGCKICYKYTLRREVEPTCLTKNYDHSFFNDIPIQYHGTLLLALLLLLLLLFSRYCNIFLSVATLGYVVPLGFSFGFTQELPKHCGKSSQMFHLLWITPKTLGCLNFHVLGLEIKCQFSKDTF